MKPKDVFHVLLCEWYVENYVYNLDTHRNVLLQYYVYLYTIPLYKAYNKKEEKKNTFLNIPSESVGSETTWYVILYNVSNAIVMEDFIFLVLFCYLFDNTFRVLLMSFLCVPSMCITMIELFLFPSLSIPCTHNPFFSLSEHSEQRIHGNR